MTNLFRGSKSSFIMFFATSFLFIINLHSTGQIRNEDGQVVEKYLRNYAPRSGMALGGIGTGSIELRKNGKFYNWTIFNNWPKETGTPFVLQDNQDEDQSSSIFFFKVRYQVEGEEPQMKLLQINEGLNEGAIPGLTYYFPWMSAVEKIEYSARFPFVNMTFTDKEMPFDIHMEAWSPFIPHDVKNSSLPIANFDFRIENKTSKKIDVTLIASLRNTVAYDHDEKYYTTKFEEKDNYLACNMSVGGMDQTANSWGEMCLVSHDKNSTYYGGWSSRHPYYEYVLRHNKLPNLDDTDGKESILLTYDKMPDWLPSTNGRNMVHPKTGKKLTYRNLKSKYDKNIAPCFSSVAITKTLDATNSTFEHSFSFAWNFPNKYASVKWRQQTDINEGQYYSNFFSDVKEIAEYASSNQTQLYQESKGFLNDFFASSLDTFALEQINSQLNTFVTSGRLVKDGYFGIMEGLAPSHSWGPIATIDVALYGSLPAIALFPELQKSMMRAHRNVQTEDGKINHGLFKNFHMGEDETWNVSNRIDLPGQYIIMVARDYFWTNDKEYLEEMYPSVLKALDYVLNQLDLNKDLMPDMEGHRSSYDNFPMYGLASYIQSQWLCAMASLKIIAEEMDDKKTTALADKIFKKGSILMDKHLWNGNYYRLYNDYDGIMGKSDLNEGCLTDQIIGQWAAHQSGLGYLFDKDHINTALDNILDMSQKENFGLRNASWPNTQYFADVDRDIWVDQGNTYWSGVELAFASFLIYEGKVEKGLEILRDVDNRYRKNGLYWDHQEFGGHYYRPMGAWGVMNAMLGFSINQTSYSFAPKYKTKEFTHFFSTPTGTAHYVSTAQKTEITCKSGTLPFKTINFDRDTYSSMTSVSVDGNELDFDVRQSKNQLVIHLNKKLTLKKGQSIIFR